MVRWVIAPFALVASLVLTGSSAFAALPPPSFTCQGTGGGSICRADFPSSAQSFLAIKCGSGASAFDVVFTFNQVYDVTQYFDQAGLLFEEEDHFTFTNQALTNSVSGKTITSHNINHENDNFTFTSDASGNPVPVTHTQTGSVLQITLAGQGVVVHQTGLGVYNAAGQVVDGGHPQLVYQLEENVGDVFQFFCTALA